MYQGNGFELYNLNITKNGLINFVSRTGQNNGVTAQVEPYGKALPFPAGYITVSLGGSVLSAFVQTKPFYTAFHVMVLSPKRDMTFKEKLFYCMCINKNAYRYNYGRQANKTLKNIEVPDTIPDWFDSVLIKPISTNVALNQIPLEYAKWRNYKLGELFRFEKGKRLTKADMVCGNDIFLGAVADNNGVSGRITAEPLRKANCITVNYNGSVGEAFYQSEPFWASDDVNILYAKNWEMNKFNALFIVTVIKANRYRFNYGRKWTMAKMKETLIKLPSDDSGLPDFEFMENYIKSLQYSDRI